MVIKMKKLSLTELNNAPSEIQFLYWAARNNVPVSSKLIQTGIEKYPEYFKGN